MEACFSQVTLDIIGKAVFNYEFNALTSQSPIIQAVYTALKETESRSTDLIPYWKSPVLCAISPRQQKAAAAVQVIRECTEDLIRKCKDMVDQEEMAKAAENVSRELCPWSPGWPPHLSPAAALRRST